MFIALGDYSTIIDEKGNSTHRTMCHGGDSQKLHYYKNSRLFQCYTNCGSMDIFDIVIKAKEIAGETINFFGALVFVAEATGKRLTSSPVNDNNTDIVDDWEWLNRVSIIKPKQDTKLNLYNENVLRVFLPYLNNWVHEDISPKVAKKYEVGWYIKTDSIIIPHRDEDGGLVGIRQRNTRQVDIDNGRKYIPTLVNGILHNHQTSRNLYGLNITKSTIKKHKRVYIFEGEKSCMKSESYYGEDNYAVAISGSNISDWQVSKILNLGVEHVILALDKHRGQKKHEPDEAYENYIKKYKEKLNYLASQFAPFCRTYVIWDRDNLIDYTDSPIDRGKDIFEQLTDTKIEIRTKDDNIA